VNTTCLSQWASARPVVLEARRGAAEFHVQDESRIEEIKREYNAGSLPTAADLIEDLHNWINTGFPP